jgi:hypothetical protein
MVTKQQAFPSKWLSAADLPRPIVVEIIETNEEMVKGRDGLSTKKVVVYFRGAKKGLILNATNFDSISEITGELDTEAWPGCHIELFPTQTEMGGKRVDCIRIRKPGAAPKKAAAVKAAEQDEVDAFGDQSGNPLDDEEAIPF